MGCRPSSLSLVVVEASSTFTETYQPISTYRRRLIRDAYLLTAATIISATHSFEKKSILTEQS